VGLWLSHIRNISFGASIKLFSYCLILQLIPEKAFSAREKILRTDWKKGNDVKMNQTGQEAERLKRCGLKKTRGRENVMKTLEAAKCPVTAEKIFWELKKQRKEISLSTVYRILGTLVKKEIAKRTGSDENGRAMFELNRHIHRHYLVCLGCHKMIPVEHCPLGELEKRLEQETGFSVTGHSLEIYGYCADCQKQMLTKKKEK
jgi:Fur family ferric uptake transcriptional regulator